MFRIAICLLISTSALTAAEAKDLRLEYKRNASGVYTAVLDNKRAVPVTAYLAEASFSDGGRERHSAMGGDTLGFTNGEDAELPPMRTTDTGRTLPRNAPAGATRVLAAIFADGVTEGEDEVIAMLMAGRHRALADLNASLKMLSQPSSNEKLMAFFQSMQAHDQEEGASLDELQDAPGRMRYRYFMSAVPMSALTMLQAGGNAGALAANFRGWQKRLLDSKPDVR